MKRALVIAMVAAGCNQTNINTPIRVFDRPSDVALACRQLNVDGFVFDARPLSDCAPDRISALTINNPNKNDSNFGTPYGPSNYFLGPVLSALVTQSARGELANVDVSTEKVIDLQPAVPGFGFLPVGKLPEHVRVSDDGCVAVTANVDSCDVGWVDLATAYNMPFLPYRDGGVPPGFADQVVRRMEPTVGGKPLGARPTWVEFTHDTAPALRGWEKDAAGIQGTPGQCVTRQENVFVTPPPTTANPSPNPRVSPSPIPTLYHAWVALPGCQLVAQIDVTGNGTNAEVLQAIRVTQAGAEVVTDLASLSCPAECSGAAVPDASVDSPSDGGVPSDGGTLVPATQAEPSSLALDVEGNLGRLFIADRTGEKITILPFDPVTGQLGTPRQLALEKGAIGVEVVRISPRSEAGKFLYAVARDATVRVIDLDRELECETNPDPRALQAVPSADPLSYARRLGCFPLGDPSTPRRSALFTSPGITLPGFALPHDVAFVHVDVPLATATNVAPPTAGPATLVGDFAWIISSDGRATAVTIFDDCPAPNMPQPIGSTYTRACDSVNSDPSLLTAFGGLNDQTPGYPGHPVPMLLDRISHRPRAGTARFFNPVNLSDNVGQPRLSDETNPFQIAVAGLAKSTAGTDGGVNSFPSLVTAPTPIPPTPFPSVMPGFEPPPRYIEFIDPDHSRNETWSMFWEGTVPGTHRATGVIDANGPPDRLIDSGASYCARGVLAGDKLNFTGCDLDSDCDYLASCVHDPDAPLDVPQGMCLPKLNQTQLARECVPLLRAIRRYRILSARQGVPLDKNGGLTDALQFAEIYEPEHPTETHTCAVDADCADVVLADAGGNPAQLATSCLEDSDGVNRCLRACKSSEAQNPDMGVAQEAQCGLDFQCLPSAKDGKERCILSPLNLGLFNDCMPELKPYEVRSGESFLLSGSVSGTFTDLQANPLSKECEVPPESSEFVRLHQARIPLVPVECPASISNGDTLAPLPPDLIDPATGAATNTCLVSDADGRVIHFENPFFSFLVRLPAGGLAPSPSPSPSPTLATRPTIPPRDFSLSFTLLGSGFPLGVTLAIDVTAQQPRYTAVAPDRQTVFVVDEGKQSVGVGLRGQLLKMSSNAVAVDRSFQIR